MFPYAEIWYCCLHPIEQTIIIFCEVYFLAGGGFVPKEFFDEQWTTLLQPVGGKRYNQFIATYGLTYGVVPISEEEVMEVYFLDALLWGGLTLWFGSGEYPCAQPCFILRYAAL